MITFEQCARCCAFTNTHTMSMFNIDLICIPCKDKEKKHSDYKKATDADIKAIVEGNYNFKGIGKPADL